MERSAACSSTEKKVTDFIKQLHSILPNPGRVESGLGYCEVLQNGTALQAKEQDEKADSRSPCVTWIIIIIFSIN
jgi:hypothetical protein